MTSHDLERERLKQPVLLAALPIRLVGWISEVRRTRWFIVAVAVLGFVLGAVATGVIEGVSFAAFVDWAVPWLVRTRSVANGIALAFILAALAGWVLMALSYAAAKQRTGALLVLSQQQHEENAAQSRLHKQARLASILVEVDRLLVFTLTRPPDEPGSLEALELRGGPAGGVRLPPVVRVVR